MRVIALMLVLMLLISCGCGEKQEQAINEPEPTTGEIVTDANIISYDIESYIPDGFIVTDNKNTQDGSVFVVATIDEVDELSPHVLLIATNEFIKRSVIFMAKEVKLGLRKSWGASLIRNDNDTLGYAVSIDFGTGDIPGYFVKVFVNPEYNEVSSLLGAGYVARDFTDIDGNGGADLLMIDTRWADVPVDVVAGQPFTQAVCEFIDGHFVDMTSQHNTQMSPGLDQFKIGLSNAQDDSNVLYYAINLMLTMYAMGEKDEAVEGFLSILNRLNDIDSIEFANDIIEHLRSYDYITDGLIPPWFNPTNEPAWTPLDFEKVKVNK